MSSARRLYRVILVLGVGGALVLLAAVLSAAEALSFAAPPLETLIVACRRLLPEAGIGGLLVLSLAALAFAVLIRSACALGRRLNAGHRFRATLSPAGALELGSFMVELVDDERPQAFCAGYLRPCAFVSTGAVAALSAAELAAVVAHERYHAGRRDPLRILVAEVIADGLFFLPAARSLSNRYRELAELGADEAALRETGDPRAVASALLRFGESTGTSSAVIGIAPERVDHLLGEAPRWRLPAPLVLTSALTLGGLLAAAVATVGMSVNAATLVVQSCMALMVAVPASALAASLLVCLRRRP